MIELSLRIRLLHTLLLASVMMCVTGVVGPKHARADDIEDETNAPDEADATEEIVEPFVVREAGVFLLSAYGTNLNDRGLFLSTLPGYTLSRRPSSPRDDANTPTPLSLLTFSGPATEDIDVLLEFEAGRFLSHWPPARMRSKRLLWSGIDLSEAASTEPARLADDHWLSPLRDADRLHVLSRDRSERGMIYDAELKFAPHVTLERTETGYRVSNSGKFPIHDVHIYRPADEGQWTMSSVDVVEGVSQAEEAEGDDGSSDADDSAEDVFDKSDADASQGNEPAATEDAEAEESQATLKEQSTDAETDADESQAEGEKEASGKKTASQSADAVSGGRVTIEEALHPWTDRLVALGLGSSEADHITTILKAQAFRSDAAMLVYRLDEAHLEKLLPLEVTPYPDRLFRVAVVIVQDADPDLQSQIEELVTQLGDDHWPQREAAQTALEELGLAAKPKLEAALKNEDMEVVFRAEQLLESLQPMP